MIRWLAEHRAEGEVAYRVGRDQDALVAEWLGVIRLDARRDGTEFQFVPYPDADPRDVEKIMCGSGRLLLRHLQGKLALHGAAVEIDGRAVVLLGGSGDGKSTLAASLCARPEVRFLADDAVALDRVGDAYRVVPLERDHWLEPDARAALGHSRRYDGADEVAHAASADRKAPVTPERRGSGAQLVAFVDLRFTDVSAPVVRCLHGLDALASLMPQVVRFVIDEPEVQQRELDALLVLLAEVQFVRIERPRSFALLPTTGDLVVDMARRDALSPTAFSGV